MNRKKIEILSHEVITTRRGSVKARRLWAQLVRLCGGSDAADYECDRAAAIFSRDLHRSRHWGPSGEIE